MNYKPGELIYGSLKELEKLSAHSKLFEDIAFSKASINSKKRLMQNNHRRAGAVCCGTCKNFVSPDSDSSYCGMLANALANFIGPDVDCLDLCDKYEKGGQK